MFETDGTMETSGDSGETSIFDSGAADGATGAEGGGAPAPEGLGSPAEQDLQADAGAAGEEGEALDPVAALEAMLQEGDPQKSPQPSREQELQKLLQGLQPGTEAYKRIQTLANARTEAMEAVREREAELQRASAFVENLRATAQREVQQREAQITDLRNQLTTLSAQMQQLLQPKAPQDPAAKVRQEWVNEIRSTLSDEFKTRDQKITELQKIINDREVQARSAKDSERFINDARRATQNVIFKGMNPKDVQALSPLVASQVLALQMHTDMPVEQAAAEIRKTLIQTAIAFQRHATTAASKARKRAGEAPTATQARRTGGQGEGIPSLEQIRARLGDTADEFDFITQQVLSER